MEMTREELDAVVNAAHARDARVRGHIVNKEAILTAIDVGVDVIDHADEMDDECIERHGRCRFVRRAELLPPDRAARGDGWRARLRRIDA